MTRYAILLLILFILSPLTKANITSTTGNATLIPRPADDRKGALVSDTQAYIWPEAQNYVLTAPIAVDLITSGTFRLNDLSTTIIPAGPRVNSYYFSFDTPGNEQATGTGSITFDQPIVAVIARNSPAPHLDDSNYLGLGTLFSTGDSFLGLDGSEPIGISFDRRTFTYDLSITSPGDHFRILTQVPEPAAIAALCLLFPVLKRRR